jgi:hypothetical protein
MISTAAYNMMNQYTKQANIKELTWWLPIMTIFSVPERMVIRGPYSSIHPAMVRNELIAEKSMNINRAMRKCVTLTCDDLRNVPEVSKWEGKVGEEGPSLI